LRHGVKFHDGTDFNADAVVFTLGRIYDDKILGVGWSRPRGEVLGMDSPVSVLNSAIGIVGIIVGWTRSLLTRRYEEAWFGPKLVIDCQQAPGKISETDVDAWMKFRVQNSHNRRVAKNCRAYIVGIYQMSNNKVISGNLKHDSAQLSWSGYGFIPLDIPPIVSQYVDIVRFSKDEPGWMFYTHPDFYSKDVELKNHQGTYRIDVVVAGDGVAPKTYQINIDYKGDWKGAIPYDA
jgi:hypothetical protein